MTALRTDDPRALRDALKVLAEATPDEITMLPAREIHVGFNPAGKRPTTLVIGVYGRDGRPGVTHGVQLTRDGALLLLRDLAAPFGVSLRPARLSRVRRGLWWPRRRAAVRQSQRELRRVFDAPPSEEELMRVIFAEQISAPGSTPQPGHESSAE
jgi:hypothetical protein